MIAQALVLALALVAAPSSAIQAPSAAASPVVLAHVPVAGERVVQAFVLDRNLVAQSFTTITRGEAQTSQEALEFGGRVELRLADAIREVANGRATLFQRQVEAASVRVDMRIAPPGAAPRSVTIEGGSPLSRSTVLFRYVEARGEYGRIYDGLETSEEFLPRLEPQTDLSSLLPDRPVAPGDTWSIEPPRLRRVLDFGGSIPIRFTTGADGLLARTTSLGVAGPLRELVLGDLTGTVNARLVAVEAGVARIELEFDVRAVTDQTAVNAERLTPYERYDGLRVENARAEWSLRGKGECSWLVDARRARALSLAGAEDLRLVVAMDGPGGKGGSDLRLAGGLKLSIDVSATR